MGGNIYIPLPDLSKFYPDISRFFSGGGGNSGLIRIMKIGHSSAGEYICVDQ